MKCDGVRKRPAGPAVSKTKKERGVAAKPERQASGKPTCASCPPRQVCHPNKCFIRHMPRKK
ncbi:hypothetical protein CVS40_2768 [Lucilia cuprina]|nr:hypothetical protein CVS40_2768 [Lucilia cuprina]